jgi:hypothetical protein
MRQWCLLRQMPKASRQRMHRSASASGTQTAAVKLSTVSLGLGPSADRAPPVKVEDVSTDASRTVIEPALRGRSEGDAGLVVAALAAASVAVIVNGIAWSDRRRWRRIVCSSVVSSVRRSASNRVLASRMAASQASFISRVSRSRSKGGSTSEGVPSKQMKGRRTGHDREALVRAEDLERVATST